MITLRLMEDTIDDYTLMRDWFLEPELQEWVWCDKKGEPPVSLEHVMEKYGPRVKTPTDVFPYFILNDGVPIGFIQYYIQNDTSIGLDMWIGVWSERNHGYGTDALKQMIQLIRQQHPHTKEIFIDPEVSNKRAIKCYQKAGFIPFNEIEVDGSPRLLLKVCFE